MALNVFPIQLFILRKAWKLDHINTPQSLSGSIMLNSVNIKLLKRNTPGGPVYAPGAPEYAPGAPVFAPGGPVYASGAPVYAPGTPVFAPGAPVYAPNLMMWEQAVHSASWSCIPHRPHDILVQKLSCEGLQVLSIRSWNS